MTSCRRLVRKFHAGLTRTFEFFGAERLETLPVACFGGNHRAGIVPAGLKYNVIRRQFDLGFPKSGRIRNSRSSEQYRQDVVSEYGYAEGGQSRRRLPKSIALALWDRFQALRIASIRKRVRYNCKSVPASSLDARTLVRNA